MKPRSSDIFLNVFISILKGLGRYLQAAFIDLKHSIVFRSSDSEPSVFSMAIFLLNLLAEIY